MTRLQISKHWGMKTNSGDLQPIILTIGKLARNAAKLDKLTQALQSTIQSLKLLLFDTNLCRREEVVKTADQPDEESEGVFPKDLSNKAWFLRGNHEWYRANHAPYSYPLEEDIAILQRRCKDIVSRWEEVAILVEYGTG